MPEKLKNLFFTSESINLFADRIKVDYCIFNKDKFLKLIYDNEWESRELKAKMRHVAICLHECLPQKYEQAIIILIKIAPHIKGFEGMVLPDYVELYGLEHWETSINQVTYLTPMGRTSNSINRVGRCSLMGETMPQARKPLTL